MTTFWFDDPTILLKSDAFSLWPNVHMDANARLNAVTRVVILVSVATFALTRKPRFLFVGAVTVVLLVMYQKNKPKEIEGYEPQNLKEHTLPTKENPMMNVQLPELNGNPKRKSALKAYHPETKQMITDEVKKMVLANGIDPRVFRGLNNEDDLEQSMRQFYTMPNTTVPNNQEEFGKFCYGDMISAKEGNKTALERNSPRLGSVPN
jgi:Family of unknown function (DUF5762)